MTRHASLHLALFGLALSFTAGGCVGLESDDSLGETTSELSVSSWTQPGPSVASADLGAQIATLGATTLMVRTQCCSNEAGARDLAWLKLTPRGDWTPSVVIPGQTTLAKVTLAAFGSYIYMVRTGANSKVFLSRFDPSRESWSPSSELPYTSFSMPAIVAFQNKLWFIGSTPTTRQMWTATMDSDEVFSTASLIPDHFTGWPAAAAVFNNRLFVVHSQDGTSDVAFSGFNGSTWSAEQYLPLGPNGARIRATEPTLAAVNGFLHLVYETPESTSVKWTYFDRCEWAPAVSIGPMITHRGYSLAQGGPGLVLETVVSYGVHISTFTAPPAPIMLPTCGVIHP